MRVAKNTLIKFALEKCKKDNFIELSKYLAGSNILLSTNMNPFKLVLFLDKSKMMMTAKAGDRAQDDIQISAGNTGLPPGPVISELNEVGIRSRINEGSVWVVRDTVVAKKDEVITPKLASVLSKLGIKPLEVGLNIIAAYQGGSVLTKDELLVDVHNTQKQIIDGFQKALNISINTAFPTHETIIRILQKGYREGTNFAINVSYPTIEVIDDIIRKAYTNMLSLTSSLGQINKEAIPQELK
jgi:large subunit ribosomal protein L10